MRSIDNDEDCATMNLAAQRLRYTIDAPLNQVVSVLPLLVRSTQADFALDREPGPEASWRLHSLPDRRPSGRFTLRDLADGRTELLIALHDAGRPPEGPVEATALVASIITGLGDYGFPVESLSPPPEAPARPPAILLVASTPRFFQALSARLEPVAGRNGFLLRYLPAGAVDDSAGLQRGIAAARMLIADLSTDHGVAAAMVATARGCLVVPVAPVDAPVPAEWQRRTLRYGRGRPGFLQDLLDRVIAGALGDRHPGPGGAASAADFIDQTIAMPAIVKRDLPAVRADDPLEEQAAGPLAVIARPEEDEGAPALDMATRPAGSSLLTESFSGGAALASGEPAPLSSLRALVSSSPADARRAIYRTVALDSQATPEQRFHAARVLATYGDRETAAIALAALIRSGAPMRSDALAFLDSLGAAAAVALWTLDATEQTPEESIAIARRLHAIGDTATARLRLESLAHHPDRPVRRAALEALSDLGPVAYPEFGRLVRDARDPRIRLDAARWLRLYKLDLPEVVETLAELADQTDSPALALDALHELAAVREPAAFETLVILAHSAPLDAVRRASVEALRRRGDAERACSALLSVAASGEESGALGAAGALFALNEDPAVAAGLLDSASAPAVRLLAATHLVTADRPETLQYKAARELLAQNQVAQLLPVLERLAETAAHDEIRRWAAEQLEILDPKFDLQGEEAADPVVAAELPEAEEPAELGVLPLPDGDELPFAEEQSGSDPQQDSSRDREHDPAAGYTLWLAIKSLDPGSASENGAHPPVEPRAANGSTNGHQPDVVQQEVTRELLTEEKLDEALPLLYRLAMTATDQSVRGWALEQLAALGSASVPTVLEVLDGTDDPATGLPLAEAVLLSTSNATTHRHVAAWLAGHGNARRAAEVLAALVEDPRQPRDAVEAALADLMRMAGTQREAVTTIAQLAREARSDSVRQQALGFLLHYHVEELPSLGILLDPAVREQLLAALPRPSVDRWQEPTARSRGRWSLPDWLVGGLEQLNSFLPGGGRRANGRSSHDEPAARSSKGRNESEENGNSMRETSGESEAEREPIALLTWVEVAGRDRAEPESIVAETGDEEAEATEPEQARNQAFPASLTDLLRADGVLDVAPAPAHLSTSERTEVCLIGLKSFSQVVEFQKALLALPEVNRVKVQHVQEGVLNLDVFHRPRTDLALSLQQLVGFDLRVSAQMPGVLSLEAKASPEILATR